MKPKQALYIFYLFNLKIISTILVKNDKITLLDLLITELNLVLLLLYYIKNYLTFLFLPEDSLKAIIIIVKIDKILNKIEFDIYNILKS